MRTFYFTSKKNYLLKLLQLVTMHRLQEWRGRFIREKAILSKEISHINKTLDFFLS